MAELSKIAEALGLAEDADEKAILEELGKRPALSELADKLEIEVEGDVADIEKLAEAITARLEDAGEGDDEEKSLEDRAKDEGKTVVDSDELAELQRDAKAGKKASDELHQSKFDAVYEKALDEVRVDGKDETREEWQELYDAAPEQTLKRLAALPKLANTESRGSGESREAPEGVDPDRHELDQRIKARAKEEEISYSKAMDQILAEDAEEVPA